jgi:hypothetical protein
MTTTLLEPEHIEDADLKLAVLDLDPDLRRLIDSAVSDAFCLGFADGFTFARRGEVAT